MVLIREKCGFFSPEIVFFSILKKKINKKKCQKCFLTEKMLPARFSGEIARQMAKLRPNLGQFWPKRAIFVFSQKMRKRHIFFSTPETRIHAKNKEIQMHGVRYK